MTEFLSHNWLLLALCASAVLVIAFGLSEDARVARRVFVQFILNIALPLLVIFGGVLVVLAVNTDLDERIWAAIIAGLVIATGWLTTAIFGELGKSRDKAEKLRDYHKALYAEIGNTLQVLWDRGQAEQEANALVARMEADLDFIPLIPREHNDFVYDSLVDEIEVLPRVTIDAVVAYYSLIKSIAAQAEDMRGDVFRSADMTQDRRILMYRDYFETRKSAFALGQYALRLIKEYAENGPAAAEQLAKRLSNPVSGRSGQSPESE
ncbi:MAG: hypothetical protein AB3N22_07275 [Ruegeria sp.]